MTIRNFALRACQSLAFILASTLMAVAAHAQAPRTWVSHSGSDSNPCSRTAPCQTFFGALANTQVNGEVSVLTRGSYGQFTISRSVTIDGTGGYASVLVSGLAGVFVSLNDATDIKKTVRLRGLSFNGVNEAFGANTGLTGISVTSALVLHIEDCLFDGLKNDGIDFSVAQAAAVELHVRNSVIRNCQGNGILATNTNASGLILTSIDNCQLSNNGTGLNAGSHSRTSMRNSTVSACTTNGVTLGGTSDAEIEIVESTLTYNPSALRVNLGTARVAQNLITGNTNGLNNVAGTIETFQNNQLRGNANNTVGVVLPVFEN